MWNKRRKFTLIITWILCVIIFASCNANKNDEVVDYQLEITKQEEETTSLVFWSTETQPDRAEVTNLMISNFTEQTGIPVELVLVEENSINNLMQSSEIAGLLPDVVFFPMSFASIWHAQGILDADAAMQAIDTLNPDTFSQGALAFVTSAEDKYVAIPSDGWGQLLIYRTDLFAELGLDAPTTQEQIQIAAQTLEAAGYTGILAGTAPNEIYTQQTFEQFALAHGVQLIDDQGTILFDTPEMIEVLTTYTDLMKNYGPGDASTYWLQARELYFSGKAGMVIWSPFILDEMAGLRDSTLPNCPECADDIAYLAKNSGIIPSFSKAGGEPAQWGVINCLGITKSAETEAALQFVDYWMNEAYLTWLGIAPEGKTPMRKGTLENPTYYIDQWSQLEFGVDRKVSMAEFYGEEILQTMIEGSNSFEHWGFSEGNNYSEFAGVIYTKLIIPQAIADIIEGRVTPEQAAEQLQLEAEEILASMQAEK